MLVESDAVQPKAKPFFYRRNMFKKLYGLANLPTGRTLNRLGYGGHFNYRGASGSPCLLATAYMRPRLQFI